MRVTMQRMHDPAQVCAHFLSATVRRLQSRLQGCACPCSPRPTPTLLPHLLAHPNPHSGRHLCWQEDEDHGAAPDGGGLPLAGGPCGLRHLHLQRHAGGPGAHGHHAQGAAAAREAAWNRGNQEVVGIAPSSGVRGSVCALSVVRLVCGLPTLRGCVRTCVDITVVNTELLLSWDAWPRPCCPHSAPQPQHTAVPRASGRSLLTWVTSSAPSP